MKSYPVTFCASLVLTLSSLASAQTPSYNKLIVTNPTGSNVGLVAINDLSQAVGTRSPEPYQASLWTRTGGLQDLPTPSGFSYSEAVAINDQGQIAGFACAASGCDLVLWTIGGGAQDLGNVPGYDSSFPTAINNNGWITGTASSTKTELEDAFVWTPSGGFQDLGNLGGYSVARSINDSGVVIGYSTTSNTPTAAFDPFEWTQAGGMQDLTPTLGDYPWIFAINDSGEIVGVETQPTNFNPSTCGEATCEAFSWTPSTGIQTLGYVSGFGYDAAVAINSSGAIVGWAVNGGGSNFKSHGILWTPNAGMQDLQILAFPKGNGKQVLEGVAINNAGVVLAPFGIVGQVGQNIILSPKMTVTLTSSQNPSVVGQPVTFTAMVNSIAGPPPDGEQIVFHGTGNSISAPLSNGVTTVTVSTLAAGNRGISGSYAGDANYLAAPPVNVLQVVNKASTTTTLVSSPNPSTFGQFVTFTATVASQFGAKVAGSVTFVDGTNTLKTVGLRGATATLRISTLVSGTHSITATYNGNPNFSGSSASLTQTVN